MKNILNKLYIHPITLITIIIFILIGRFKFLINFMILILVHESGHIILSQIFKWNIDRVIILPFGGIIKFNEKINKPLKEEFLISISGIIFQLIFFFIYKNYNNYKYFTYINYFIIIFNLIPIYPLDGSKVLNILFNIFLSFKNSIKLTYIVSYINILLVILYFFNINKLILIIMLFLFIETTKLYINKNQIFNKYLLERYLNDFKFKKSKIINNIYEMKRDYKHIFYCNSYITEKSMLKSIFK